MAKSTAKPATANDKVAAPADSSTPSNPAQATIRTMIVIVPDGLTPEMINVGPSAHSLLTGINFASRWWARPSLRVWQRRALINVRRGHKGTPTLCAGGPIGHLDLTLMRNAAAFHAGLRWQQWSQAVAGTRAAQPWHVIEAQHRADPSKLSLEQARKRFDDQPRINAMRLHNAAHPTAPQLDVNEVELYQAGNQGYQHYHAMTALCGDALMPAAGDRLQPASDSLADRISYLATATRLLDSLPGSQRIVAVTVMQTAAQHPAVQ